MTLIVFTKHLRGLDLPQLASALKALGVRGADFCVREGYPVNPANIQSELPKAKKIFAGEGLSIPLVTSPGDFSSPSLSYAEKFYAACGEAGVEFIKLGYWAWDPKATYQSQVDEARAKLEGFQDLSRKHSVKTLIHTHSGANMGLNASAALALVKGFDPRLVGVFADPGHLSLCGEPIGMALSILGDFLSALALKDLKRDGPGKDHVVPMGQGFVDWRALVQIMKAKNFGGPLSFHCEYEGLSVPELLAQAKADLGFFDAQWGEA